MQVSDLSDLLILCPVCVQERLQKGELAVDKMDARYAPGVPLVKDAYASERRKAKILNFSLAYGKTRFGLAKDFGVDHEEAGAIVERWYNSRPEVRPCLVASMLLRRAWQGLCGMLPPVLPLLLSFVGAECVHPRYCTLASLLLRVLVLSCASLACSRGVRVQVRDWQERVRAAAQADAPLHRVHTMLGRTRALPGYAKGKKQREASRASRAAINTPIQGSAADVVAAAMVRAHADPVLRALGWRMLLQVHDEARCHSLRSVPFCADELRLAGNQQSQLQVRRPAACTRRHFACDRPSALRRQHATRPRQSARCLSARSHCAPDTAPRCRSSWRAQRRRTKRRRRASRRACRRPLCATASPSTASRRPSGRATSLQRR